MTHIGRLQALGVAYESSAGTKESASAWMPKISGLVKPVVETMKDTSGYGVIDEVYESEVVKEYTETTVKGIVSDRFIGYLLLGTFGASAISGAGPYTHAFTRLNTNSHPTFTLWGYDPVQTISACYSMIDSITFDAKVGEFITVDVKFIGKKRVTESSPTVAYSSAEHPFRARDCKVYFSDSEGSWGTAIEMTSLKLTVNKNLYIHQALGEVDIDSIFNQQFTVSGDFELLYDSVTYQDYVRNGTNKYMKIELINTDVTLSGGGNPTLTFTLGKVVFETRDETTENNEVVKQTVGFSGAYNNTATYTAKASLINEVSADYDA